MTGTQQAQSNGLLVDLLNRAADDAAVGLRPLGLVRLRSRLVAEFERESVRVVRVDEEVST